MPIQSKDKKQSIINNQKDEEETKKMLEFNFEEFISKITETTDIPPEIKKIFIDYAKKNPKTIIHWLSIINQRTIKSIDLKNKNDKPTVVVNVNTHIFNLKDSQATISTGDKSLGTLLSANTKTQTIVENSIIKQLKISSKNNPDFSNEIDQFKKELKNAKTDKEKASILTRIAQWYNQHKDEIIQAEQLITSVLDNIHDLILK